MTGLFMSRPIIHKIIPKDQVHSDTHSRSRRRALSLRGTQVLLPRHRGRTEGPSQLDSRRSVPGCHCRDWGQVPEALESARDHYRNPHDGCVLAVRRSLADSGMFAGPHEPERQGWPDWEERDGADVRPQPRGVRSPRGTGHSDSPLPHPRPREIKRPARLAELCFPLTSEHSRPPLTGSFPASPAPVALPTDPVSAPAADYTLLSSPNMSFLI